MTITAADIPWVDGHADVWRLFADADLLRRCVEGLVAPFRDDGITHVAGLEARGFLLGGAAAIALGAGFVAIRKTAGHFPGPLLTANAERDYKGAWGVLRLQAGVLGPRARVLVVDDWIESGSQFRAARGLIVQAGAHVAGLSVIVDQSARPLDTRLHALIRMG
jgi:adenine phosphoribosyltransferase